MSAVIEAPIEMVEAVADLHLPPKADQRLQYLMDRNNDGALTTEEREQLEALVELSETIAIVRASASRVKSISSMSSRGEIALQVEARAASRCEYCGMHQALQGGTFHVEHIVESLFA